MASVASRPRIERCPRCGIKRPKVVVSRATGNVYCTECGFVIENDPRLKEEDPEHHEH